MDDDDDDTTIEIDSELDSQLAISTGKLLPENHFDLTTFLSHIVVIVVQFAKVETGTTERLKRKCSMYNHSNSYSDAHKF